MLEVLCNGCNSRNNTPVPSCGDMCSDFKDVLNLPTIDAVPVVRCKDCEYTDTEVGLPDGALYCNEWSSVVRSYWYCCRGARMDGGEDV